MVLLYLDVEASDDDVGLSEALVGGSPKGQVFHGGTGLLDSRSGVASYLADLTCGCTAGVTACCADGCSRGQRCSLLVQHGAPYDDLRVA